MKIFERELEHFRRIRKDLDWQVIKEVMEVEDPLPWKLHDFGRRGGTIGYLFNLGNHQKLSEKTILEGLGISQRYVEEQRDAINKVLETIKMSAKPPEERSEYGRSTQDFIPGDRVELHPTLRGISKNPGEVVRVKFRDVLVRIDGFRKIIAIPPYHLKKIVSTEDEDIV